MSIKPQEINRRSFVYPRLVEAGAEFADRGDCAVAERIPAGADAPLRLFDLSPLFRTGIKGRKAREAATAAGWPVPEVNNTAVTAPGDGRVLRLGDNELLVLSGPTGDDTPARALEEAIPGGGAWHVPRRDSHCWFLLEGDEAVACLAKLCGVDLRPGHFPAGRIAQTSIARLNGIVCRDPDESRVAFHLLVDSASAIWFWDVLLDAMHEFGGRPAGLADR
jgi:sarcosine oxidase subunit gamma